MRAPGCRHAGRGSGQPWGWVRSCGLGSHPAGSRYVPGLQRAPVRTWTSCCLRVFCKAKEASGSPPWRPASCASWLTLWDTTGRACYQTPVCVPNAQWGQTNWNVVVWSREGFIAGPCKELGGSGSKVPELPEGFQQSRFKGQVREGHGWWLQSSWCRNPLFLQLSMWVRSWCSCKPPRRQMLFSVLQLFISIWMDS